MPKGNIPIDKSTAKEVIDGVIVQTLPYTPYNRVIVPGIHTCVPNPVFCLWKLFKTE